ncbi:DUF3806 domain-containing protein [Agromyces sp. NPDC057865]|uniref:DUF3806 domain-containing protein n=1 Tax=Agromyces sp. NPDC057865 TaxID=3346267 RepID=UPI00366ABAB6
MPLFSKRSAPADAAPLPRLREIGEPERDWISAHVELVTRPGADLDDLDRIRSAYESAVGSWRRINPPERDDPTIMVNAIAMAFGEHLVRRVPLRWVLADDEHGTELALHSSRPAAFLVPAKLVGRHWAAEDLSSEFLRVTTEQMVSLLEGRRRSPR